MMEPPPRWLLRMRERHEREAADRLEEFKLQIAATTEQEAMHASLRRLRRLSDSSKWLTSS